MPSGMLRKGKKKKNGGSTPALRCVSHKSDTQSTSAHHSLAKTLPMAPTDLQGDGDEGEKGAVNTW